MAKWSDVENQVQGDLQGLKGAVDQLTARVATLEGGVEPGPAPTPTPTAQVILSTADQQAVFECLTKWERVAIRFEVSGVTFDWRDSSNKGHHIDRGHPKQFAPTIAEAYQNWLSLSADTRVARQS